MWSFAGPQPRPALISIVIERETTSRLARSLAVGRVALHEALAFGVRQVPAFAAGTLGDQAAGREDAGGMELDEFHVLGRQPGAQYHARAVAGAGVRRGAGQVGTPVSTGCQDNLLGTEAMDAAVFQVPGHHAAANALLVHDQVEREVLDEEFHVVLQALLVQCV